MLKHFIHAVWLSSIAALALVAIALTAVRVWVPALADYRHDVEQAASLALGRPVTVARMEATWRGLSPVLKLKDVRVAAPDAAQQDTSVKEIWVRLDVGHFLRNRQVQVAGVDIIGADLVLVRDECGEFYLEQFRDEGGRHGDGDDGSGGIAGLLAMSRLSIHESSLTVRDELTGAIPRRFSSVTLSLINSGDQHRLSGHAYLPADVGYRVELDALFTGPGADIRTWQGRTYLKGQSLSLSSLLQYWLPQQTAQGIAELRLWVDVDAARVARVAGELDARDVLIARTANDHSQSFSADSLGVQVGWHKAGDDWQGAVRLLSANQATRLWEPFELSLAGGTGVDVDSLRITARQLVLDDLWQFLPAVPGLEQALFARLATLKPTGRVDGLDATLLRTGNEFDLQGFTARFQDLGIAESGAYRLVTGLDGTITGSSDAGTLALDSREINATDTRLFRNVMLIDRLQGDIDWQRSDDTYRLTTQRLALVNPDMKLVTDFALTLPAAGGAGAHLDLDMDVESMNVARVSHYLPAKVMSPTGVGWLDRSLLGGEVRAGTVQMHGRFDQLPFDNGEGKLEVRLPVYDATLDFNPDWTPITNLDAQVDFTGRQMDIHSKRGNIRTAGLKKVHARIVDLANPYLTIDGDVQGQLPVMLAELGSSPLGEKFGGFVDRAITTGACRLLLDIEMPLKGSETIVKTSGRISLTDNSLEIRESGIKLTDIGGELTFDEATIQGDGLQASLFGRPASARVWGEPDSPDTHISLSGKLALFDTLLGEQDALRKAVTGDSDWRVLLTLHGAPARGKAANIGLRVSSTLAGTAIDLPPPLGKPLDSEQPLLITVDNAGRADKRVRLKYGDELNGLLKLAGDGQGTRLVRGMVTLGGGKASLPAARVMQINGRLDTLHLTAWQPWLQQGRSGRPSTPVRLDLDIGELEVLDYYLDDLHLSAAAAGRAWTITASGASTRGEVELTKSGERLEKVVMNMQRLTVKKPAATLDESASQSTPADMPEIQVTAGELVYNGMNFGQLDFKSVVQGGNRMIVERLLLSSDLLSLRLNGEWRMTDTGHLSEVELAVTEGRMGELLDVLGYEKVIKGGELTGSMQASWPARLWEFSPEIIGGKLDVKIKNGQLLDVEPGATGRALGLLSLGMIPKRLSLDFSDLFGDGFGFERITGNFVLDGGNGYTNDLMIDGPAAKIEISGRVGLADKDYNELVTVTPYLSSGLPLAGAIAGGPAVGAAVIVAEKILGDKLGFNQMARKQYTVTGPWDAPEVTRIDSTIEAGKPKEDFTDELYE